METPYEILLTSGRVDSPLKLHLLLVFLHHPMMWGNVDKLNVWLRQPPWDVEQALEELVATGLLTYSLDANGAIYRLQPHTKYESALNSLNACYDDPLERETIYAQVRAAYQEQQIQEWLVEHDHSEEMYSQLAERAAG